MTDSLTAIPLTERCEDALPHPTLAEATRRRNGQKIAKPPRAWSRP